MLASYALSLFFAITCGYMAATSPSRERIILPFLDIMQSIPVLGFFPAAVYFFVRMTHGSRLGVEMAAVFLIFTCQAWNMAFGVYEGISTIPADAREVVTSFGCGKWRTFLRLLLPSAVPKLIYNSILSWAGGWYFLIACEIIALGPARYRLPGLGSYLIKTTEEGNLAGTFAGLAVLTLVVLAMDLLIWGPLSAWAGRFRYEFATEASQQETRLPLVFVGGAAVARWIRRISRPVTRRVRLFRIRLSRWARRRGFALARRVFSPATLSATRTAFSWLLALLALYVGVRAGLALARGLALPWPEESHRIPLYLLPVVSPAGGRLRPVPGLDDSHGAVGGREPAGVAHRDAPGGNRRLTPRHRPLPPHHRGGHPDGGRHEPRLGAPGADGNAVVPAVQSHRGSPEHSLGAEGGRPVPGPQPLDDLEESGIFRRSCRPSSPGASRRGEEGGTPSSSRSTLSTRSRSTR